MTPGGRLSSPSAGIWLLVAAMLAVTVGLFVALGDKRMSAALETGVSWWLLLPLFALAEVAVLHVPTARGAHTHSLRELPNLLGLAFLAPTVYLVAHLAGTGAALVLHRKQRGTKLAFNLALFALEVVVGVTTYRLVLGDASPADPRGWVAALAATLLTDVLSALLIAGVIALHERKLDRSALMQTLTRGSLAAVANTALACLVVVLLVLKASALPLLLVVLLVLFVTYRAYLVLWVGHARVHQLYRFVQETADLSEAEELVAVVLRGARDIMYASAAELVLLDGGGQHVRRRTLSEQTPDVVEVVEAVPDEAWWRSALEDEAVHADVTQCDLHGPDCRGGVAAPLRLADSGVTGVLLVHDRTVDVDPFRPDDAQLFATLTAHASAALDNAFMLEELRRVAAEREHQAMHDSLTGLSNRAGLLQRLESALDGGTLALLLLGTDDMARVDEVLGHVSGMALLRLLAQRLSQASPEPVYRLEGDQFAVAIAGRGAGEARELAGRLVAALRQPLLLGAVPLHVTARVGIACAPLDGADAEELVRLALLSLHAGAPGAVTMAHGTAVGVQDGQRRLVLAADLSAALDDGGLEVWYQPQVVLGNGTLRGAEALLRWRHPTYSWVNPGEIVDVAERTGQLLRLTEMVLATALEQRARWHREGLSVSVSVNLAAQTIHEDDLADRVVRHLWATRTPARLLVLEVTESGVMRDSERGLDVLRSLSQLGVELSIDDFGTGQSSLAYLDRLPVQEVKIDRAFVQGLNGGQHDSAVLRSTIGLAHEMGLRVVVEGVEAQGALRRLEELGCDLAQGYVIARPMPGDDLFAWWAVRQHAFSVHEA